MMELNIEIQSLKGEKTATTTFPKVKEKKSALSERQAKKKKTTGGTSQIILIIHSQEGERKIKKRGKKETVGISTEE